MIFIKLLEAYYLVQKESVVNRLRKKSVWIISRLDKTTVMVLGINTIFRENKEK